MMEYNYYYCWGKDTYTRYFNGNLYSFVGNTEVKRVELAYAHIEDKKTDTPIGDSKAIVDYLIRKNNVSVWSRVK